MKTALITGSTKCIGLEIARQLATRGYTVWISGRNERAGTKAVAQFRQNGIEAHFVRMDVGDMASIRSAFDTVASTTNHMDALVNNAGIQLDNAQDVLSVSPAITEEVLRVNLLGALYVTQVFSPLLTKGSCVINISSTGGQLTSGMGKWAPIYCISKAALNGLTIQLAHALKPKGVAVNSVSPGWVRTDMGGPNAPRSVEQGAETPVWLATEAPIDQTGLSWQDKKVVPW